MRFGKTEAWCNFRFLSETGGFQGAGCEARLAEVSPGVFRLRVSGPRWPGGSGSDAGLLAEDMPRSATGAEAELSADGRLVLSVSGEEILSCPAGKGFGLCGKKWIFCFAHSPDTRFYGLGEKGLGFELSGKRSYFWNTDAMADFHPAAVGSGEADPLYASFPVIVMRRRGLWAAVVVDNPYAVFVNAGAEEGIFQPGAEPFQRYFSLGSTDGAPDLYFIAAADPAEVMRRAQSLQGRTPLPPLWALGHQQCRWGYKTPEDLERVASEFERRGIPNDGLWLDIDYMEGYRVFSLNNRAWKDARQRLSALRSRGYRIVPILDPGLRKDPDYPVYAEALSRDLLCRNPEGGEYTGYAWPGYTAFPDFSLPEAREFWRDRVRDFAASDFSGFWIDMNDPSTGSVPNEDMLFHRGSLPHDAYHNQYASGMARATREGLLAAHPDERPFVLSRSGFLGISRYAALWMGDNVSNYAHLAASIPMALNLSLSGLPFCGADVPGFGGDAESGLLRAWYKAAFLFPFLRNHNCAGTRDQEPWSRDRRTTAATAECIRSRYRLMPYLYGLFAEAEESGDPIMRPLWYHDGSAECGTIGDQFFVGRDLMHAPLLEGGKRKRRVYLPEGRWYDALLRRFREGRAFVRAWEGFASTPLFLRSPSLIPLRRGKIERAAFELSEVDFLVVMAEEGKARIAYRIDDGIGFAYQRGGRSVFELEVDFDEAEPELRVKALARGYGGMRFRLLFLGKRGPASFRYSGKSLPLRGEKLRLAGSTLRLKASGLIEV